MFWSVGWPLLWAAGFFCNLDILYRGLGIGKLQFLIKIFFFFFSCYFFQFLVIKALDPDWIRIRIRIDLQPLPLDPDPEKMNTGTDPKHWLYARFLIPYLPYPMDFLLEITKIWQESRNFWFADFFLEILKIHSQVWIFLWIFGCFESVSSMFCFELLLIFT